MQKLFGLLFSCAVLGLLALMPSPSSALGISPGSIVEDRIPQNFELKREFFLTRGNPSEDEKAKITVSGSAAQNIELLTNGDTIDLPKGRNAVAIPFKIKTGTLGADTYKAQLTVTVMPRAAEDGSTSGYGSQVLSGATGLIRFTVSTDAVEAFTIDTVYIQESEVDQPIGFSFRLSNQGTASVRPEKIELAFLQNEDSKEVYKETIDKEQLAPVPPLETQQVNVITMASSLPPGNYRGVFSFYSKEKLVLRDESVIFRIYPQGVLSQQGELITIKTEKAAYEPGESIKFIGEFSNTGDIGLAAMLNLEIFSGSKRIEALTSKEVFVPKKQTTEFELFYQQEEGGTYSARGYTSFGAKKSNTQEITFTIKEFPVLLAVGVGVGILIIISCILLFIKKRRQKAVPPATIH
ncbi:MAG: hypothetical protein Q8P56_00210 [Candidatus Uhrbacteria bacterium]|nr:hypothetical protein [Candidatus Uhrbacteria bacterium]